MLVKTVLTGFLAVALVLPIVQSPRNPTNAQNSQNSSSQQGITKEQAAKIIEELQMIRMLLQQEVDGRAAAGASAPRASPSGSLQTKTLTRSGDHLLGNGNAPVTLVEFVDLQCPFCIEFQKNIFPEIKQKYIDTGKLKFVALDFPLPSHAYALSAAIFAWCAGTQGKYWQVHDAFLSQPQVATPDVIHQMAIQDSLDQRRLDVCMNDAEVASQITRQEDRERDLGVIGTPSFLLGKSSANGVSGDLIEGAPSLTALEQRIDTLLAPTPTAH